MPSVRRVCPRCREPYPVDAAACPRCGHSTEMLSAVSSRPPTRALLSQGAIPVALGVVTLAVRAGVRLFRYFLRHTWASAIRTRVTPMSTRRGSIVIDFWGQREVTDDRGRSVRERTRARWEIRHR
jgi:hypothetical protein